MARKRTPDGPSPPDRTGPADRTPSQDAGDDDALFRGVFQDAKPLKDRDRYRSAEPPPRPPAPARTPEAPSKPAAGPSRSAPSSRPPASAPKAPPLDPSRPAGIDRRQADRLRRGKLPVEARIDLHGHTQAEAHRALNAFIQGHAAAGRRCVLVITGKGSPRRAEDDDPVFGPRAGVLREMVPRWLNQAPCRAHVLAFSPAQPKDGGGGALYVLLKRERPSGG